MARSTGDWVLLADAVTARRAAGVSVTRIAACVGVGENWIRRVSRTHGPRRPVVRVPGWVPGKEAADVLGVSAQRLAAAWRAGELAGVTGTVGWNRLWHLEQLRDWWPVYLAVQADTAATLRVQRDTRIRALAGAGAAVEEIARAVGVGPATIRRTLTATR